MRVAVIGATGLVGRKIIEVLQERKFPVSQLIPAASENSAGKEILYRGEIVPAVTLKQALALRPQIALFSAGASVSQEWAPKFAAAGCKVIDNSSFWRMNPSVKLIVPEVNGNTLDSNDMIIANPNCSTIQMVVALNLLNKKFRLKRIVVSTYQSVTGSGQRGIAQLGREREGKPQGNAVPAYKYPIDKNLIPQIDSFLENGYTKEEMKMINETQKIFGDESIGVTATTVRVPVEGGHSESVNAIFERSFNMEEVFEIIRNSPGVVLEDDIQNQIYPMPLFALGRDEVFIGRVRKDFSAQNAINLWIVADNLRKGAATNAVQIAEQLLKLA
ncbi:MAG: hypothetical protein ACD_77C00357G0002 [uncultured bacterium]|nr:MAG: hypothetical protein ACD_77C00357G0002 [uncultured bacterium]HBY01031.1 aspartate-semialdehyde dehydrogenase [Rikenellaceae bacterium]